MAKIYIIRKIADKMREKQDILAKWMTLEVGKPFVEAKVRLELQLIYLNGMQRKRKEYMDKLLKADLRIQGFTYIINPLEL